MNIIEVENAEIAADLFKDWQESLIWSCLQKTMGYLYAEDVEEPEAVMAILGDFCYFAGKPDRELVMYKPEPFSQREFMIMVPQNEEWGRVIEEGYGERAKKITRYAIKKERDVFDQDKLQKVVDHLPSEYTVRMIDEELYPYIKENRWTRDWVAQFRDCSHFMKEGLGVVVLKDGVIVSGASSYSVFTDGIEIEIDTREDYRRRGLAYVCGAKLILECLKRGWYPSWDAQNKWSVALAEKLGYHYDRDYTAYAIWGY